MVERRQAQALLAQLTNRWSTPILAALVTGPFRSSELIAVVPGISEKMLHQNLRMLVRMGLIDRSASVGPRPQVSYSLSQLGADLAVPLCGLIRWICDHTDDLLGVEVDSTVADEMTHDNIGDRIVPGGVP